MHWYRSPTTSSNRVQPPPASVSHVQGFNACSRCLCYFKFHIIDDDISTVSAFLTDRVGSEEAARSIDFDSWRAVINGHNVLGLFSQFSQLKSISIFSSFMTFIVTNNQNITHKANETHSQVHSLFETAIGFSTYNWRVTFAAFRLQTESSFSDRPVTVAGVSHLYNNYGIVNNVSEFI